MGKCYKQLKVGSLHMKMVTEETHDMGIGADNQGSNVPLAILILIKCSFWKRAKGL